MKTSIVIPIYNKWELTHRCLFDIYQKCNQVDEVVIVNDNSPEQAVYDGLKWWKESKLLPLREIRLSENVMFLRASNIGMRKATGDVIVLLSNDVRVYKDILNPILTLLDDEVQPNTLVGGRLLDWDTGWNTFDGKIFPYLEGWLLAARKDAWEKFGYFDDRYAPSDMEDVDLSTTAKSLGYHLVALLPEMTQHIGGQSIGFNPAREAITIANKEKFRLKWNTKNSNKK